ncbi:Outer membrane cobalamin receptor protein [uncultured Bacteroides sp.]|uniref:SusC/RagA family TonB-linked outer membrane protein n=1 Tax=Bacteroides cellulolyticus TaxID=2981780 RepID=UPI000820CFE8|nr:TonB-dependent receptor [Bacteroides cellulolyticus]MCU6772644.1 TonB-dependent receptor [Bacteroides cellulolyticus]SCI50897.1 Outer membrane cobalamin receptor protein [uncultured Bacteroides sp.]
MKKLIDFRKWYMMLVISFIPLLAFAQEIQVQGNIIDENGEPLIGVSVLVQGTGTGTVSDFDGNFILNTSKNSTLVISYVGYKEQQIIVKNDKPLRITMIPDTQALEEVVVIAYGSQKKVTVTGSVSNVSSKELLKSPSASLGNAISGKLPGLSTVQYSGVPGADDPTIFIRGQASLNGSNPLVLVDGVERSFTQIDPNEVADITILKDASATAVYGVRGANGVILVTTKRGTSGKTQISASTSWGIQTVTQFLDMADSYTYATTFNNARLSDGNNTLRFSEDVIEHFRTHDQPILYPDIDWVDYAMNDMALQSQHNISINGGNQVARYFVSLGMLDQDGMFKTFGEDPNSNFSYRRYNYRANLDLNLGKLQELSINLGGRVENKNSIGNNGGDNGEEYIFRYLMDAQPFSGAGIVDGKWIKTNPALISNESAVSQRDGLDTFYGQGYKKTITNVLNLDLIYKLKLDFITKGLDFRLKGSYNSTYYNVKDRTCGQPAKYMPYLDESGNIVYQRTGDYWNLGYADSSWPERNWYAEASFNYSRSFGNHNFSGLLLYNQSKSYYSWDANNSAYISVPKGYVGLVGRVTYDYNHRYMIDVNMGYNGSENFAKGHRYGIFPSASVGWTVSEENFWKPIKPVFSYLKLRASVGTVGNDNCQGYRFLYLPAAWTITNGYYNNIGDYAGYNFGTTNTTFLNVAREYSSASPDVTWETAVKYNYGFDAKFWNDKISLGFDYFTEDRKNILINNENMIQAPTALRPSYINYGRVKNHGYEITLSYSDKIGKDFSFTISPTVSYAKNKIIEQAEITRPDKLVKANSYMGKKLGLTEDTEVSPDWTYATGHSIGARKGYLFFEFYEKGVTEERYREKFGQDIPQQLVSNLMNGDAVYVDLDGDGVITEEYDQMYMGYTDNPEFTFALNFSLQYKNFDFSMLWSGAAHVSRNLDGVYRQPFGQQYNSALLQWVVDNAWTEENAENAKIPRITFANEKQNQANSNIWYYDSKYLRLKNVEIGYNINNVSWLPKGTNLRVFANGTNLLTFTPLDANDPENTGGGYGSFIKYPLMRVFNLGLKVNF